LFRIAKAMAFTVIAITPVIAGSTEPDTAIVHGAKLLVNASGRDPGAADRRFGLSRFDMERAC
jgi:hypothetical protein